MEVLQRFLDAWHTRGDSIRLSLEVRAGRVPPFDELNKQIGDQLRFLPRITLPDTNNVQLKAKLMEKIREIPPPRKPPSPFWIFR